MVFFFKLITAFLQILHKTHVNDGVSSPKKDYLQHKLCQINTRILEGGFVFIR